jgi:FKBP-type peptidyl-prolyl cis-trans isomerase FklB
MKFKLFIAINIVLLSGCAKCVEKCCKPKQAAVKENVPLTKQQRVSYALGSMIANDLKRNGVDSLDKEYIAKAFGAVFNGDSAILSDEESKNVIDLFSQEMRIKQEIKRQLEIDSMSAAGKKFLAENKNKVGVLTTPSGLQYKIIKPGSGAYPTATDQVEVHYEGKLLDGKIFDSSFQRGETITFGLNQVIRGWTEGMQHISEGGEIELYIPYDLGYGEQGTRGIPPYSTLIFRVQLIKVHNEHDGHNH